MKSKTISPVRMTVTAIFASLFCVCAWIAVPNPFGGAMFTMQTFAILLAGLMLTPLDAALAGLVYFLLGLAGLPVFSGGVTMYQRLFTPFGGYIIGFFIAPFVVSLVKTQLMKPLSGSDNPAKARGLKLAVYLLSAVIVGTLVIDTAGIIQFRLMTGMDWSHIIFTGAIVFLPTDIIKALLAVILAAALEKPLKHFYK